MADGETHGRAHSLEFGADFQHVVPGLGERVDACLLEHVFAVNHRERREKVRHRAPFAVYDTGFAGKVIPAAICFANSLADVADVDQHISLPVGLEISALNDVRATT